MLKFDQDKGFTILQTIITLAILAILVAIGIPGFVYFRQTNELRSAAEQFYTNVQFARSEAINKSNDIYIDLRAGTNWCYGLNEGSSCNCNNSGNCTMAGTEKVVKFTDYSQIVMSESGFSGNQIKIEALRGTTDGATGTVSFTIGTRTVSVQINPLGRARICSDTVGGFNAC